MAKNKQLINSALIVVAALVGAFGSRYLEKVLAWPFPLDIIGAILAALFLWWVVYSIWGKDLK